MGNFPINKINLMKKLFLLFATVTLLVGVQACKQKPAEDATEVVTTDSTEIPDTTNIDVPAAVTDTKGVKNTSESSGGGQ